jgi:YgiT-type zinc finger domain-containing protein
MNNVTASMMITPSDDRPVCPQCGTGILHIEKKIFFKIFGEDVISVPDFPFWKCSVCKWTEYDVEALDQLIKLLGVNIFKESGVSSYKLSYQMLKKGSWLFWHK